MLAVVTVAYAFVAAAAAGIACGPVLGRVHVPDFSVGIYVGSLVEVKQSVITYYGMRTDLFAQGRQQTAAAFVFARSVVSGRFDGVRAHCEHCR